ncbi:MAG TPA: exosortase/archaeosortase family protein [Candidatus Gastranaerophilales bacterium]|nr:exosortase/archaeosortase family protein [Candidatus Gastranaerophilales bacterium]
MSSLIQKSYSIIKKYPFDILIFLTLILMYLSYLPNWFKKWTDFDSFYSFFPFLILFFYHFYKENNEKIQNMLTKSSKLGWIFLIPAILTYYAGTITDIAYLVCGSLILLIFGGVLFLYGKRILNELMPVLILFSISIPVLPIDRLAAPLQILIAEVITGLLNFMNVESHNLGCNIYIGNHLLTVEAGCTGVKSLSSLLIISIILIYFKKVKNIVKIGIFALAFILSVLANITRIMITNFYIIYNGTEGADAFHYNVGFAVFVLSLIILFITVELLEEEKSESELIEQE